MTAREWVAGGVCVLAVVGFVMVFVWVAAGLERARDWWHDRRGFGPDQESEQELSGLCFGCFNDAHCDGAVDTCICTCTWPEDWAEEGLPPERSWEQLTSHQLPIETSPAGLVPGEEPPYRTVRQLDGPPHRDAGRTWVKDWPGALAAEHERLEPTWRAEIAAALAWWEELPSGTGFTRAMAARVRELAP